MSDTVIISLGHDYREVTPEDYEANYSNATDEQGGWALLTDQEYGRAALAYLAAVEASDLTAEEFGQQAAAFQQAVEQT